jgi:hypothetical protein
MTESAITTTTTPRADTLAFLHDSAALDHLYRVGKAFSLSGLVPVHFQGKPEACLVALMYAQQLGEHPMLVFQELSVINGRPSTSARFAIARANKSGLLAGPITWSDKGQGDALEVTARAKLRESGEVISATVSMREAAADGWTRNPKYKSIPGQMLRWRAATRLISLYLPEVLFGLGVREELETVKPATVREVQAQQDPGVVADLNRQIAAAAQAPEAPAPAPAAAPAEPDPVVQAELVSDDPF